jgi:hypothetical protein
VAIGLIGICWAVAIWVPFALVMEVTLRYWPTRNMADALSF